MNTKNNSQSIQPLASRVQALSPQRLGFALGTSGVVFYLGCMLTMATVSKDQAITFFNSLLHGLDVSTILVTSVSLGEVMLGLCSTFILGWFAGMMIAGVYNFGLHSRK